MCERYRYLVNPDQTLQIHYVTAHDAGKYTCTAVNDVGMVSASAQLLVEGETMSYYSIADNLINRISAMITRKGKVFFKRLHF